MYTRAPTLDAWINSGTQKIGIKSRCVLGVAGLVFQEGVGGVLSRLADRPYEISEAVYYEGEE